MSTSVPAAKSRSKVDWRTTLVPVGTVRVNFAARALVAGAAESKPGPVALSVAANRSAGFRPAATAAVRVPAKPEVTPMVVEPAVPVPATSAGAAAATGRTASWLCIWWMPSVQVSAPRAYRPKAADVRVKVTLKLPLVPGDSFSADGVTVVVTPAGACTDTV